MMNATTNETTMTDRQVKSRRRNEIMTPEDLDAIMSELFGGRGWKTRLCELLEIEPSTVTRWCNGRNPIPKWLAVLTWALRQLQMQGIPLPDELWGNARKNAAQAEE